MEMHNKEKKIEFIQSFFNEVFKRNLREKLNKFFYSIAKPIQEDYRNILYNYCKGKRVLEIGGGQSDIIFTLALNGAVCTSIDISDYAIRQSIEKAQRLNLNINFKVMDVHMLRFRDTCFDLVCGGGILHHLDLNKAIKEIHRVLKKEGKGLFIEPLGHNIFINLFRLITPKYRLKDEHPLKWRDLQYIRNNFSYTKIKFYFLLAFFAIAFRKFNKFGNILILLSKIDNKIFSIFPFVKRYAWQVLILVEK